MSFNRKSRFEVVVKIINKVISTYKIRLQFNLLTRFVHCSKKNKLALVLIFELAS